MSIFAVGSDRQSNAKSHSDKKVRPIKDPENRTPGQQRLRPHVVSESSATNI